MKLFPPKPHFNATYKFLDQNLDWQEQPRAYAAAAKQLRQALQANPDIQENTPRVEIEFRPYSLTLAEKKIKTIANTTPELSFDPDEEIDWDTISDEELKRIENALSFDFLNELVQNQLHEANSSHQNPELYTNLFQVYIQVPGKAFGYLSFALGEVLEEPKGKERLVSSIAEASKKVMLDAQLSS